MEEMPMMICEWCNNPISETAIHDCYEKRNKIPTIPFTKEELPERPKGPHIYEPGSSQFSCKHCGQAPLAAIHALIQGTVDNVDNVNHPPHYSREPVIYKTIGLQNHSFSIHCIDVIRSITDMRLATAIKYIWRVAFGGKAGVDMDEDIKKAIWYLNDFLEHKV